MLSRIDSSLFKLNEVEANKHSVKIRKRTVKLILVEIFEKLVVCATLASSKIAFLRS